MLLYMCCHSSSLVTLNYSLSFTLSFVTGGQPTDTGYIYDRDRKVKFEVGAILFVLPLQYVRLPACHIKVCDRLVSQAIGRSSLCVGIELV